VCVVPRYTLSLLPDKRQGPPSAANFHQILIKVLAHLSPNNI
jgi:hypothetical protein